MNELYTVYLCSVLQCKWPSGPVVFIKIKLQMRNKRDDDDDFVQASVSIMSVFN